MTMFHYDLADLTADELAADIATCQAVLKTGMLNGFVLDSDCEAEYRDRLTEMEEELESRRPEKDYPPIGAFNDTLFFKAFGGTPEEIFDDEKDVA